MAHVGLLAYAFLAVSLLATPFIPLSLAAEDAAAGAATNAPALTAAEVAGWNLDRCRAELVKLDREVASIPAALQAAQAATVEARRQAESHPTCKPIADDIARLTRELEQKRSELRSAVEKVPAVSAARARETSVNERLAAIHRSIAAVREQLAKRLAERDAGKAKGASKVNP